MVVTAVLGSAAARGTTFRSAAGPRPLPAERPLGWIAIENVSDGCGQEGSVFRAHDQTYETDDGEKVTVDFNEACNLHDAAYSGALVWDSINGEFIDYSLPRWTKAEINEKFKHDLQRLCFRAFPDAAKMNAEKALHACLTSNDVRKFGTWGALSFYDIVNSLFGADPRPRVDLSGRWKNTAVGYPLCDVGGNEPMTITQNGRTVTARWQNGTGGQIGHFTGTLITGGNEGDDIVVGEFAITEGENGPKVSGGAMTFRVLSSDSFDFNGTGLGGSMARTERSTQAAVQAATAPPRCKKPATTPSTPALAGAFTLVPGLTEIKNAQGAKLTIDATGHSADLDHTGPYGGAGNGGDWKTHYTWQVPQTLIPGKKATITLGAAVTDQNPVQPLQVSINALAPDFAQQLIVPSPNPSSLSKSYAYTLADDQKDSTEVIVTIGFESSSVTYHYRHP